MTRATTVWEIPNDNTSELKRLHERTIDLEKTLEDWVEKHPDLVEPGWSCPRKTGQGQAVCCNLLYSRGERKFKPLWGAYSL